MRARPFDVRAVDLPGLCQRGGSIEGQAPLAGMSRLAAALMPPVVGDADWSAQGTQRPVIGGEPETWLHLQASASVPMECQRCLQRVTEVVTVDRRIRFVDGEDTAARLDEASEDDVLALQARLNLLELLEDELILTLPLVPMHAICPQPLLAPPRDGPGPGEAVESDATPNPFAALAALRGRTPQEDG